MSTFRQLQLGERLIGESIERYGIEAYRGTLCYLCDASAETMRAALARLPDGTYDAEGAVDADGAGADEEHVLRAKIVKRGARVEVDMSGTSRQARTCINAGALDAKTSVAVAFKLMLDPLTPFTSGAFRDIDIVVPPGTMLSAMPPDGAIMLYWEVAHFLLMAIVRTLGRALGADAVGGDFGSINIHNAHGSWPDGRPWTNVANAGGEHGPWGATRTLDGDSYSVTYQLNNIDPATEGIEQDSPTLMLRKEYAIDSGGPGWNRGGAAVLKDTLWLTDAEHYSMPLHTRRPSGTGVYGGGDGRLGAAWLFEPECAVLRAPGSMLPTDDSAYCESTPIAGVLDPETKAPDAAGEYFYFARVPVWRTRAGAVSRYLTNGAGGWGNPFERDPERVLRDVRNGYVSIAHAREAYGVVVTGDPDRDPEGLRVDTNATAACRAARR